MGDTIPQLSIPPIPILPHAVLILGSLQYQIRYLAHMMYFGVPGTSVLSERLFSKAGEVVAARRSNIKPKNVDMILFFKQKFVVFWHCAVIY